MDTVYNIIHNLFKSMPELALFISLGFGYLVGKINLGKFQMGGVAGTLLMAVVVSQIGVHVDDVVKNILFALFIFAVGFTSGPMFFKSLGKQSLKEIVLAASLAVSGLVTVLLVSKLFHLDKGLAAGIAAGGLTQSAIMGTAESSIAALNLGMDATHKLVANISVGYGVTYIFGSFGTIIVCTVILQKFMGRTIRDDAIKMEASMHAVSLKDGQMTAVPSLTGRIFAIGQSAGMTVGQFEQQFAESPVTVERLKRGGLISPFTADTVFNEGDKILIVGKLSSLLSAKERLGNEFPNEKDMELIIQTRKVVVTTKDFTDKPLKDVLYPSVRHGVYITSVTRDGNNLMLDSATALQKGDILSVYGAESDVNRVVSAAGYPIIPSIKTDFVYMSLGLVAGLLIGKIVIHAGNIPVTLGSGGGALLSGLIFGWFRTRHLNMGQLPDSTAQFMKDLGLAGFVAVVGLNYGMQAVVTVKEQGLSIFIAGLIVTIVPLLIAMLIGRFILRYDNVAVFAGALSGSRSANPAFGEVLDKAENSVPTVPFAITYALANVFLTLLGPIIVALA